MKTLRKAFKIILLVIAFIAAVLAGIVIYAVITDYRPGERTVIFETDNPGQLNDTLQLSLLSWNIGYCGLDKDMDFFYDGGTKVFTPKNRYMANLSAVKKFLKANDSIDIFLIQEMDTDSKRSFHTNQLDTLSEALSDYHTFFGKNYDVFFVPVPPASPMGKVTSGIAIFSRYLPSLSVRYSFSGKYGFPKQLFMLDRCFLVNRYPLENGKELVVINTHNEAFDPGEIRKAQMDYLREFLLNEYRKGNYIVAGGDWNQSPPDFRPEFTVNPVNKNQMMMTSDYLPPDWHWIYDNKTPTNRSVIAPYEQSVTTTTVIDFYLLSPNIIDISVNCINLNFENSDHNPVRVKIKLKAVRSVI